MDHSSSYREKPAGSGYLTQASMGWIQPARIIFNPVMIPPNHSTPGIFLSYLREIDKLSRSKSKSIRYILLVEELCDFIEEVDQDGSMGLESKLVKFMTQPDGEEPKPTEKTAKDNSSKILDELKKQLHIKRDGGGGKVLLPVDKYLDGQPQVLLNKRQVGFSSNKLSPKQTSSKPDRFSDLPKKDLVRSLLVKGALLKNDNSLGFEKGLSQSGPRPPKPPHFSEAPKKNSYSSTQVLATQNFGTVVPASLFSGRGPRPPKPRSEPPKKGDNHSTQLQVSGKAKHPGPPFNLGNHQPRLGDTSFSVGFPKWETFRDLFKPTIIHYPQPHRVSREMSPFCTIDSTACQLSFKAYWNGLSFAQAEEVWNLNICVKEWLTKIAQRLPEAEVFPNKSKNSVWPLYCCPKIFFVGVLYKAYIKMTNTQPNWARSEKEMDQFLNTCTVFHTIQTIKDAKGLYAPGFDNFGRIYCMYAMQPETMSLRYFLRQIVVPVEQTNIISGEKVTITPILWDPHKSYDILRKHTSFTMNPPYLNWNEDTKNFTGTMNITRSDCSYLSVDCILQAHTIEDLPQDTSLETKVEASINLRVMIQRSKEAELGLKIPKAKTAAEGPGNLWKPPSGFELKNSDLCTIKKPGIASTDAWAQMCDSITKSKSNAEYMACSAEVHGVPGVAAVSTDNIGMYGGTHPIFKQRMITHEREGIISLRWDPEQWLSVIVRVENIDEDSERFNTKFNCRPDGEVEHSGYPATIDKASRLPSQGGNSGGQFESDRISLHRSHEEPESTMILLKDNVEQVEYEGYVLTLGLEIEFLLAKYSKIPGSQVFEDIATIFEQLPSTKVQSIELKKPGSFGTIVFGADTRMKDRILGFGDDDEKQANLANLGIDIEKLRCIQWRKIMIPKILGSLGKINKEAGYMVTVSMHIGKRGGYTLQEVKRIAKAIGIYGDLFDYTKMLRDEIPDLSLSPDFGSSRHNPYSKNFSASQQIDSIDKAVSLNDVIEIMNPEKYGVGEYRFNFSKLKSQGTIMLTQTFPTDCTNLATKWISGMLATTTAAMRVDDSDYVELAKAPGSWQNFELLLANDKEVFRQLAKEREEAQKHREVCFMPGEEPDQSSCEV